MDYPIVDIKDGKPVYSRSLYPPELAIEIWWENTGYSPLKKEEFSAWILFPKLLPLYSREEVGKNSTTNRFRDIYEQLYLQWKQHLDVSFNEYIHNACNYFFGNQSFNASNAAFRIEAMENLFSTARHWASIYRNIYPLTISETTLYELSEKIIKERYGGLIKIYAVECRVPEIEAEFSTYWEAHRYLMAFLIPPYFQNRLMELRISSGTEYGEWIFYSNPDYILGNYDGEKSFPISGVIATYTVLRDV